MHVKSMETWKEVGDEVRNDYSQFKHLLDGAHYGPIWSQLDLAERKSLLLLDKDFLK